MVKGSNLATTAGNGKENGETGSAASLKIKEEHMPYYHKVGGLIPAIAADTGREVGYKWGAR